MLLLYSKTIQIEHLKLQKFHHCPVMTKQLAQNVIAEFWSKIICKIMVNWPKNRANIPFRADINMVLPITLI